jgi:hypothetical protein
VKPPARDPSDSFLAENAEAELFVPEKAKYERTAKRVTHVSPFALLEVGLPSSRPPLLGASPLRTGRDRVLAENKQPPLIFVDNSERMTGIAGSYSGPEAFPGSLQGDWDEIGRGHATLHFFNSDAGVAKSLMPLPHALAQTPLEQIANARRNGLRESAPVRIVSYDGGKCQAFGNSEKPPRNNGLRGALAVE